jgi:hypothetical protein
MNNQVAYRMNSFPSMQEMHQLVEVSKVLASAPFYQKLGPGGVLAIYLTAREMNLPVMFCLNGGLHNIEGKAVLSAQLMNMMLINAGWEVQFLQMDDLGCELKFIYPGKKRSETFKFTIEDAKKAGYLGIPGPNGTWQKKPKDNWLYHPLDMCFSRAIASGARKYAPNVIGNCYGVGELDNDDAIMPITPSDLLPAPEKQESAQIENQEIAPELLLDFSKRNNIVEGTDIHEYVLHIARSKKIEPSQALEICCKNEDSFLMAFAERMEKKSKVA